jgi:hypothetical protein
LLRTHYEEVQIKEDIVSSWEVRGIIQQPCCIQSVEGHCPVMQYWLGSTKVQMVHDKCSMFMHLLGWVGPLVKKGPGGLSPLVRCWVGVLTHYFTQH